jgi:Tfp pilus assembly protein PilF
MSGADITRKVLRLGFMTLLIALSVATLSSEVSCQEGDEDKSAEAVALFNQGQDAHEKGDLRTAIETYEKALKIIPDFPEAELQRGNAYNSLGRLDLAETAFRRAMQLREDWSLAMSSLGSILVRKGAFAEAEPLLTKAIAADQLNIPAYAAMTELRLKTKAPATVLQALLQRIRSLTAKANPTVSLWVSQAALESALGDHKGAQASATRALALDPKNLSALTTAADIALLGGDVSAAEMYVRRLEVAAPASESSRKYST